MKDVGQQYIQVGKYVQDADNQRVTIEMKRKQVSDYFPYFTKEDVCICDLLRCKCCGKIHQPDPNTFYKVIRCPKHGYV